MGLVDVLNVGRETVWLNGMPLRAGGRWRRRERTSLPMAAEDMENILIVPCGGDIAIAEDPMPDPVDDFLPDNPDELFLVLEDDDILPAPAEESLITIDDTEFDDKLFAWQLHPVEDLTAGSLSSGNRKERLVAMATDFSVEFDQKWTKLKIADAICERIMDVKFRNGM